ncbi:MAG TPA: chemotaxis protein CheW [Longimicrobiales bacterium]
MDLLVFELQSDRFGIPVDIVRGILPAVRVTRLPGAPSLVEGVVDVHGTITPVFDPRARFGLPPRPLAPQDHLVHALAGTRPVLLRVDRAAEVLTVAGEDITAAADVAGGDPAITGVTRMGPDLVLIHDLERFLSAEDSERLDRVLAERERSGGARA